MSYKLSKRSIGRLRNVNPLLIAIAVDGIKDSPFDFGIPQHGGKRTPDEQNLLFKQIPKVTNADGFIKKSYHQSGDAFDIFAYVDRRASWDIKHLTAIARHLQKIAKEKYNIKLTWGGDFRSFKDLPHFQI